jgi:hypothetical protein
MQPSTRQHLLAAMHRAAFTFAGCFREVAEHERCRRERLLAAMRALDPADAAE